MTASIFKLRGFALGRSCPWCGNETMRTAIRGPVGWLLRSIGLRCRWCRRCLRQWVAPAAAQQHDHA